MSLDVCGGLCGTSFNNHIQAHRVKIKRHHIMDEILKDHRKQMNNIMEVELEEHKKTLREIYEMSNMVDALLKERKEDEKFTQVCVVQ